MNASLFWEYACRAETTAAYAVVNSLSKSDAIINGSSIKGVGSYKPNLLACMICMAIYGSGARTRKQTIQMEQ